jgi:hypothetical protein
MYFVTIDHWALVNILWTGILLGSSCECRQGVNCRRVRNGQQSRSRRLIAKASQSYRSGYLDARIVAFEGLGERSLWDPGQLGLAVCNGAQGMLDHGRIVDQC